VANQTPVITVLRVYDFSLTNRLLVVVYEKLKRIRFLKRQL